MSVGAFFVLRNLLERKQPLQQGVLTVSIIPKTKKYEVVIEGRLGRQTYTLQALSYEEALATATRNLVEGQILISVKLSKIQ